MYEGGRARHSRRARARGLGGEGDSGSESRGSTRFYIPAACLIYESMRIIDEPRAAGTKKPRSPAQIAALERLRANPHYPEWSAKGGLTTASRPDANELAVARGRIGGRKSVENGTDFSAIGRIGGRIGGRTQGLKNVESGHLARARAKALASPLRSKWSRAGGRAAFESGQLARAQAAARRGLKPTAPERSVIDMLAPPWKYCGDNSFSIKTLGKTRFPDFVNEETKEVIEVFGDYWHDPERSPRAERCDTPAERVAEYDAVGWKCRVVWEHEIGRRGSVVFDKHGTLLAPEEIRLATIAARSGVADLSPEALLATLQSPDETRKLAERIAAVESNHPHSRHGRTTPHDRGSQGVRDAYISSEAVY